MCVACLCALAAVGSPGTRWHPALEGEHPSTGAPGIPGLPVLVSGMLGVILEGASGLVEYWPGEVSKALECTGFSFHPVFLFAFSLNEMARRGGRQGRFPRQEAEVSQAICTGTQQGSRAGRVLAGH